MSAEGSFWGIGRTARSVAIAIHTRSRGRAMDVDAIEQFILEELDAVGIPPNYSAVLQVQVEYVPDKERLAAVIQAGLDLARFAKAHATEEELSTHVEVSFDDYGAAGVLNLAERLIALYETYVSEGV